MGDSVKGNIKIFSLKHKNMLFTLDTLPSPPFLKKNTKQGVVYVLNGLAALLPAIYFVHRWRTVGLKKGEDTAEVLQELLNFVTAAGFFLLATYHIFINPPTENDTVLSILINDLRNNNLISKGVYDKISLYAHSF